MRRRLPSLNALRAFEAAARLGSFKAAAEELAVSQSAVSHQVKGLEESLGVQLFVRKVRHIELTGSGEFYFPVLRDAFSRIADATRVVVEPGSQNILTVQVYSTFTVRWLIPRIAGFEKRFPALQLRLNTAQSDVDFRTSDVDACILIGKPQHEELHYDHLFDCELYPLCSPGYLEAHGPFESPQDLTAETLLQVYPSADDWPHWFRANGVDAFDLQDSPQFDSYDLALTGALQGLGIALGQQPYTNRDISGGMLVEIFPQDRVRNPSDWYLVCRSEAAELEKIAAFREWLTDEVAADASLTGLRRQ